MRKLLLVALAGCWSSSSSPSSKPASPAPPAPAERAASTGGATYGGEQYGGMVSLIGTSDVGGAGGIGLSGGGGGGTGTGTIGIGTIGHGSGTGYGVGSRPPTVSLGTPSGQTAALDPAIIRRYMKRNLAKIQFCYERELAANPSLAGQVTARFTIGTEGKVTQSTGAGMPPVDACVAAVIAAIEFPKPAGGVVVVNYPFIFQSVPDAAAPPAP